MLRDRTARRYADTLMLYYAGQPLCAIALQTGVKPPSLYRIRKRFGLPKREGIRWHDFSAIWKRRWEDKENVDKRN